MKKELNVSGMMCEGCEKRIINALSSIEELENVEASHESCIVKFDYQNEENIKRATEIIENLGFKVNE